MSEELELETNIREMADKLRPRVAAMPRVGEIIPVTAPNASTVAKRLEKAIETARELEKTAIVLGVAIAGPSTTTTTNGRETNAPDFLFGRQMAALDELEAVHGRVRSALERIGLALR